MLTSLALAAPCAAFPAFDSVRDPVERAVAAPLELGIQVTATHFFAKSFASDPQLLVFVAGRDVEMRWLPAGGELAWRHGRNVLEGLQLEVAGRFQDQWRMSGTFSLAQVCESGAEALWIQGGVSNVGWLQHGAALSVASQGASILPPRALGRIVPNSTVGMPPAPSAPLHVPVITPSGGVHERRPPHIEKDPLPVV